MMVQVFYHQILEEIGKIKTSYWLKLKSFFDQIVTTLITLG